MIALDTNILVRFLAEPHSHQGRIAHQLVTESLSAEKPGFVSALIIAETIWVLEDIYQVPVDMIRAHMRLLLGAAELVIEQADAIERALNLPHKDLADCILHELGQANGCSHTVTFDKRFAKLDKVELAG